MYYLCSVSVFLKGLSHVELEDYKHKSPKTGEKKKERTISYDYIICFGDFGLLIFFL